MPIREESFRIGCGRYLQKPGLLQECGKEILRLGTAPLLIGGKTALSLTQAEIGRSLTEAGLRHQFRMHTGTCNEEAAKELADYAKEQNFDVIVGIGGGVLMDFAKLVAYFAALPVVNIPTSSATCAAYTPLSVCYTAEGRTVGTRHFETEVSAVLVDTRILAAQPTRLFLAGVFDALAKFVEIKHRFHEEDESFPLGLDWAFVLSRRSFDQLVKDVPRCLADLEKGEITDTVERCLFSAIAVTGVISGIARGSNQTALAHKFYEAARTLCFESARPYLHGEIVGVGLLLQNRYNNEPQNNAFLLGLMEQYGLPSRVSEIGVSPKEETKTAFFEKLKLCSSIDPSRPEELGQLSDSLDTLFGRN